MKKCNVFIIVGLRTYLSPTPYLGYNTDSEVYIESAFYLDHFKKQIEQSIEEGWEAEDWFVFVDFLDDVKDILGDEYLSEFARRFCVCFIKEPSEDLKENEMAFENVPIIKMSEQRLFRKPSSGEINILNVYRELFMQIMENDKE